MPALSLPDAPLEDDRVALRGFEDGDAPWLLEETRDPLIPRFTSVPAKNTEADVRAFLISQAPLRARGEQVTLLAVERATGARVGPVGLHHIEWNRRTAEVGYWSAQGMRGRGLTAAAVRLVCAWALGSVGFERVELRTDVDNLASQALAQRLGFVREGVLRGAQAGPRGRRSVVVFGLLAGELT